MCMMCKDERCCCKKHKVMKGIALLIIAAVIYLKEKAYIGLSYPMLLTILLVLVGIKMLVIAAMCKDEAPKKKGKK